MIDNEISEQSSISVDLRFLGIGLFRHADRQLRVVLTRVT